MMGKSWVKTVPPRFGTGVALFALMFSSIAAGCFGSSDLGGPAGLDDATGAYLEGSVVDPELLPVVGAVVGTLESDLRSETDLDGKFRIGPLEPGLYTLFVEKPGYGSFQAAYRINPGTTTPIAIVLEPISSEVPYHFSYVHVTFVYCASFNPIGGVPCTKLVDYVAGTDLSPEEKFAFVFEIENPGLADMLVEMRWTSQALGRDMLFMIQTPPGQPLTAATTKYFSMSGGPPLRGWVVADIQNRCGSGTCAGVFDSEPFAVTYEGLTIWSGNNATIPGVPGVLSGTTLYLNHRAETWLTMFHNRNGTRSFSAIPDE